MTLTGRSKSITLASTPMEHRKRELVIFASADDMVFAHLATAWFSVLADPGKAQAVLARVRPMARLPAHVTATMRELGVSAELAQTHPLTPTLIASADVIVTLGSSFDRTMLTIRTPVYREHWLVAPDPAHADGPGRSRSVSDLIRSRVAMLVFTEGWERSDISRQDARVTRPRWHSEARAAI